MSKILIEEELLRDACKCFKALMYYAPGGIWDAVKGTENDMLEALKQSEKNSQSSDAEYVFVEDHVTTLVTRKNDKIKVRAQSGYAPGVNKLCTVKDTGNGFVVKMHSRRGQHQYLTLDYSHAAYLLMALLAEHGAGDLMGKIELVDVNEADHK